MVGGIGVHRSNDTNIIDTLADMRKEFTYFDAALAIFFETERRAHQVAGLTLGYRISTGHRLPMKLGQQGLRVKGVDLGWAAIHKEKNDVLGLGCEMRRGHSQRSAASGSRVQQRLAFEKVGQAQDPESGTDLAQGLAARQRRHRCGMIHCFELLSTSSQSRKLHSLDFS